MSEISEKIRVLIVSGSASDREQIGRLLMADPQIDVAGGAASGQEALERCPILRPDVALVDLDLADGSGVAATEALTARFPWVSVIITSRTEDSDSLRQAMLAGARLFLTLPAGEAELAPSVVQVYRHDAARRALHATASPPAPREVAGAAGAPAVARDGKVITFYSAKGGVGCTTLACNLAVALRKTTGKEVALFDCGLLFGDVGVVLNLNPRQTIVDLLPHGGSIDSELLNQVMVTHASGVKVLLAPPSPEKAELVTAEHVRKVLAALRERFDFVVIDTWPTFEERILHVLDASDSIVVPTTLEMPAIKNCKLLLDVTAALSYPPEKIALVLNRADSRGGIRVQDVEQILQRTFVAEVVSDGRLTTHSLNEGVPFVMTHPGAPITQNMLDLARKITGAPSAAQEALRPRRSGLLRTVFGS